MSQLYMSILSIIVLFLAIAIADWQSQCIDTYGVGFIHKGMFAKKFSTTRLTTSHFESNKLKFHC